MNTQRIEAFLAEMSEEARAYFFPDAGNAFKDAKEDEAFLIEYDSKIDECCDELSSRTCPPKYSAPPRKRMARLETGGLFSFLIPKQKPEEPEPPVADLELDERTKAIMEEFDTLMKKHGLSVKEVEIMLAYRVKLSRLHITEKKEILLEDFDRKEVKMDKLTKAVFLLYLKHPEGIRYKELSDYQWELEKIYSSITGRDDLDSIRKSVADLCDPLNNSINEKVSKVKKAFRDAVDDRVARFYYIDGKKGTAKRIALDRDFVLWG